MTDSEENKNRLARAVAGRVAEELGGTEEGRRILAETRAGRGEGADEFWRLVAEASRGGGPPPSRHQPDFTRR